MRPFRGAGNSALSDGRILGGGRRFPDNYAIGRLLPDGTSDPSFGTKGVVITALGDICPPFDFIVQADGRIIVASQLMDLASPSGETLTVAKYLTDGSPNAGFGPAGVQVPVNAANPLGSFIGASALAIDAAGRMIIGGWLNSAVGIARLTAAGAFAETFGNSGAFLPMTISARGARPAVGRGVGLPEGLAAGQCVMSLRLTNRR